MNVNLPYIPQDRQKSISTQTPLPKKTYGTSVFADISGFTALTEGLAKALGTRRGAEELAKQLNRVYDALITEIHAYGGSVIGFSGDAVTCWFDELDGNAADRAVACGVVLQEVVQQFKSIQLPNNKTLGLALRVGIASGSARRFLVGDPKIQVIDALVGKTIDRMAMAQSIADIGDVMIDEATQIALGDRVQVMAHLNIDNKRFGVVQKNKDMLIASPQVSPHYILSDAETRSWIQPTVYRWLTQGHGEFLTELRPATALFIGFDGIDYEGDPQAGEKLNNFIQQVQAILEHYGGTFIQLTIGDKGSYIYAAFGAPLAHEDDASRAVYSALDIQKNAASLGFITHLRMGITQGTMRTGTYGSKTRLTYGVLGDDVNIAARLMQYIEYSGIAGSGHIQQETSHRFDWTALEPIMVKGKSKPMSTALLVGERVVTLKNEIGFALPMVGRKKELAIIKDKLMQAVRGSGQVVGIVAEAGMGKSRMVKEIIDLAHRQELESATFLSDCPSYGTTTPYLVWQSLLQQFFKLETLPPDEIHKHLAKIIEEVDVEQLPNLPLLEALFNVGLSKSEYTSKLDGETSRNLRHALLCAMMKAQQNPCVIILEDTHWIDSLSGELLEMILQRIANMPILLVMAYRPTTEHETFSSVEGLTNFTSIPLGILTESETENLIRSKFSQHNVNETTIIPDALVIRILERAEGNPFYIEELINYLNDQNVSLESAITMDNAALPNSLQSLILSRIDKLTEQQKITLKVASIIGRVFSFNWLYGYYPSLGDREILKKDLYDLARLDLTPLDTPDPHLTYLFKHILTQEVTYESLSYEMRLQLHEQFASYLENLPDWTSHLGLITYHYERSNNTAKKFRYFVMAGKEALELYALDSALDYFDKTFVLLDAVVDQFEVKEFETLFLSRGRNLEYLGRHQNAVENYQLMTSFASLQNNSAMALMAQIREATLYSTLTSVVDTAKGQKMGEEALDKARQSNNLQAEVESLWNLLNNFRVQGNLTQSIFYGEQALEQAQILNDDRLMGFVLGDLGYAYAAKGSLTHCIETATKSQALWQRLGNRSMVTDALGAQAQCLLYRGDFEEAINVGEEGHHISQLIGNPWGETYCHISVGAAYMYLEEYQHAIDVLARVEELGQQADLPIASIFGSQSLAKAYRSIGDYDRSISMSKLAIERAYEKIPAFAQQQKITLVLTYIQNGDMTKANDLFEQTKDYTSPWIPFPKFEWTEAKYRLMAHQGQPDKAIDLLKTFLESEQETELHPAYTETLIALSQLQTLYGYDNQKTLSEAFQCVEKLQSAYLRKLLGA